MNFKDYFDKKINIFNIYLSDEQYKQFEEYYYLLIDWNSKMNLTTITEINEVVNKHFIDSLSINILDEFDSKRTDLKLIDIGTGAGFPGIPIKIAYPNIKITLMDSLNKRVKFLEEVINKLDLKDIEALHGRAEEYGRKEDFREKYDYCVSRAVANIATLSEYCVPFVKKGGYFISYKSEKLEEELVTCGRAIKILGGEIINIKEFTLPGTDNDRRFAVIKKINHTNKKYPRGQGKPLKEPLK